MAGLARKFPLHGWVGLGLVAVFWALNWSLPGLRTLWMFFPLWSGYCLTIDSLVILRTGTSLLTRSWGKFIGLFLASAPLWWLFEIANTHLQNWHYVGAESLSCLQFWFWSTLNFTTIIPAVFESTELASSFLPLRLKGPVIRPLPKVTIPCFILGWCMLGLMIAQPRIFFPFLWLSLVFILEPINIWLNHRSLVEWTRKGNWQPIIALWLGVLLTAFFWEMWNFLSFPKWIYTLPWGNWPHIFEMPLLGYGGYLFFAMELFALYHLLAGLFGNKRTDYVLKAPEP